MSLNSKHFKVTLRGAAEWVFGTGVARVAGRVQPESQLVSPLSLQKIPACVRGNGAEENHSTMLALWFAYYNFARKHMTLKESPAMAAGLENHVWTIRELIQESAKF